MATHEWVERLPIITYADDHSSTRLHPEWQELEVGDGVPYSRFAWCGRSKSLTRWCVE